MMENDFIEGQMVLLKANEIPVGYGLVVLINDALWVEWQAGAAKLPLPVHDYEIEE